MSRQRIGRHGLGAAAGCVLAAAAVAGCGGSAVTAGTAASGSFFSGVPATSSPAAGSGGSGSGSSGASGTASPSGTSRPARRTASPAPSGPAATLGISAGELKTLDSEYLSAADPADRRLDVDNDGYTDAEADDLAQAQRFLLAEVSTEKSFDREILRITFPPLVEAQVKALVRANNQRIAFTQGQAATATLAAMQALDSRHAVQDAAVEKPVRLIRQYLGLPPPATDSNSG